MMTSCKDTGQSVMIVTHELKAEAKVAIIYIPGQ